VKDWVYCVLPKPYADELIARTIKKLKLSPKAFLKAIDNNPQLLENLSIPECITLLGESWIHSTPYVMADIYHHIQTHGNLDDIKAAQNAICERLDKEADKVGDTFEGFPGWDDAQDLKKALMQMSNKTGNSWRKRKK